MLVLCVGMIWLLSQSSLLTERKRNAAMVGGMVYFMVAAITESVFVHVGIYRYVFDTYMYQGRAAGSSKPILRPAFGAWD